MPYRQNFPIPSVIDPDKQCLQIMIPNHPEWKAVIAGTLAELRYWYNWERTDGTEGAQCAAVWKQVFDSIDWSDMSCCCEGAIPPQYRYTVEGILQVSFDGGTTFVDAPERDVRNNSPVFPPIAGGDGNDKRCAAATGAAALVKEQIGDQLTDDMGRYPLNQLINDWTHTLIDTSNPFLALVNVVANQVFALVISAVIAALTDDVYHLFACALYCKMGADGSFNNVQWIAARGMITSSISGIAGVFLEHLVYLLGAVGTTNLVRSAPDSTGDCSDCDCPSDFCEVEWIFYNTHDVVQDPDNHNSWDMLMDSSGHFAFSSGDPSVGCYWDVPLLFHGSSIWYTDGTGPVPADGIKSKTVPVWQFDTGNLGTDTPINVTFSKFPIV